MRFLLPLLTCLCCLSLIAATEPQNLSPLLDQVRKTKPVPGMVAVVVRGQDIIASGATGVRRRGSTQPVTLDDKFHLGSCTKAMTATLCATLVEEGKLRWDSTLADVFPDSKDMRPAYRGVTLEQLLTHHAGVPSNVDIGDWYLRCANPKLSLFESRQLILEAIVTRNPQAAPGTRYIYANAGFIIAGHMAKKVTGKTWEDLMQERIFKPLKMGSVGFGAPGTKDSLDQPRGHGVVGLPVEPVPGSDNPRAMGPAGTAHCTIGDWAKFISLHLEGANGHATLLKPETFQKLHAPIKGDGDEPDYAMGWITADRPWAGGPVLTHGGTNSFWVCEVWIAPKRNLAILVMCNQGPPLGRSAVNQVIEELVTRFFEAT